MVLFRPALNAPKILISRTDALGDVILTLPMAGIIRRHLPDAKIYWLGQAYVRPVVEASGNVDKFLERNFMLQNPDEWRKLGIDWILHVSPDHAVATLADRLKINNRVGTSHRSFHWMRCNHLINLGRKGSSYHEAQLNCKLLGPMGLPDTFTLEQLRDFYGLNVSPYGGAITLAKDKFKLILHPKSSGSAREWPAEHYVALAEKLPAKHFEIYITGLENEGEMLREKVPALFTFKHVTDLTGKLTLPEFMSFVQAADGLVAASTGPLHLASALGKYTVGLYPRIKPMHPGRWSPVGIHAGYLVKPGACRICRYTPENCPCMGDITVDAVYNTVQDWLSTPIEKR